MPETINWSKKSLSIIENCRVLKKAYKEKDLKVLRNLGKSLNGSLNKFPELAYHKDVKSAKNIIRRLITAGYLRRSKRKIYGGGSPGLGKRK